MWYAAGMIQAAPAQVHEIVSNAVNVNIRRKATWVRMIVGSAGMLLVLALVYAAVNAITRGYFRPHLRTGAVIALAVALAVLFLMMA